MDDVAVRARTPANFDGFVRAEGTRLVDSNGRTLRLRGVGLGNWLLPEGYMWRFGKGGESPREIEAVVAGLIGDYAASEFWTEFRDRFITEADIAMIAANGFDHVRLPINSRIVQDEDGRLIESGFVLIDRVIEWCRRRGLWVLLDLHGAPGGQTGTNIDDSPDGKPELFMSECYWNQTIDLWTAIARRYATETVVLGYDLLNEPLPDEWQFVYADRLARLYRELTAAIRTVDTDHLIVYEGSHWATNWDMFTEVWDSNSMLQFHKYWSPPDTASIQKFLDVRARLGLPIYMGESGENTLGWMYAAFRLYEHHDIGWNLWPWKKIDTVTSPLSVVPPHGWDSVRLAVRGESEILPDEAQHIFDDLLANFDPTRCIFRGDVISAVLADAPAVIPAWGYGFRGPGISYASSGTSGVPEMRIRDSVAVRFRRPGDNPQNPFEQTTGRGYRPEEELEVGLRKGDWLEFDVTPRTDVGALVPFDRGGPTTKVEIVRSPNGFRALAVDHVSLVEFVRVSTRP